MNPFDNIPDEQPDAENSSRLRTVAVWAAFVIFAIAVIVAAKAVIGS